MHQSSEVAAEVNSFLSAWRAKAMSIVLAVLAVITLPVLVMVLLSRGIVLPGMVRGMALAVFLAVLLAIRGRGWSLQGRAWIFFAATYALAALQLTLSGLVGSGRIALIVLPLMALLLVGNRAGWLAVGISVTMFGGFAALAGAGALADKLVVRENSVAPGFWLVQGLMSLAALIPLMVLFTRFQALYLKGMMEERHARREIESAAAERRRLEAEITRISEEEQRRLGLELHDGLCQQLTAALLHCTALENDLAAHGNPESHAARRLRAMLEDCIGSAYDAAKGLCPVDLDPASLVPALRRLLRQTEASTGLACELIEEGDPALLDPPAAHHLYRVAQEAVHNAAKHARGRRIILELRCAAEACMLRVTDDGQFLTPVSPQRAGGMGIRIMNYRAKTLGGSLLIEHSEGGGTVVSCRIPHGSRAAAPPGLAIPLD